jgi:hypothetical protein
MSTDDRSIKERSNRDHSSNGSRPVHGGGRNSGGSREGVAAYRARNKVVRITQTTVTRK